MHNNITLKPRKSRETYGQHITMDELNRYKAKLLESTNDVVLITDNKTQSIFGRCHIKAIGQWLMRYHTKLLFNFF